MNEAVYYIIVIVCILALMIVTRRKPVNHTALPNYENMPPPPERKGDAVFLTTHEQQILRAALCVYEKKLNSNVKCNSRNGRTHMNDLLAAKIYNVKVLRHKMDNYNGIKHNS